ncbi:MAG: ferredoxin family protein [Anaerolineales bacterium]|jgi:2-oxoglutarate ferredoxin oxidoreductase subunit delta
MPAYGWIEVNERFCKGCELCVEACPKDVIGLDMEHLTSKGYHPAMLIAEGCTGCGICAVICPDAAIQVFREIRKKDRVAVAA